MKHLRHASFGIITVALISAFFIACSSSEEEPQQRQQGQAQQQQQQAGVQPSAADQDQPQVGEQAQQRQREQTSTSSSERSTTQQRDRSSQADEAVQQQQEQQTATQTRDTEQDEQQSAAQDSADGQDQQQEMQEQSDSQRQERPQAEQQAQQQQEAEAEAEAEAEPERSTADSDAQQQEMQPEEEEQSQQSGDAERLEQRAEEIGAEATVTDLVGLTGWLNGEETSIALELAKGNVVLIDFWTYTCINCIRTLPFLTAWDEKYREHGLVILGVHTPEFEFEKDPDNVRAAIAEHGIEYNVPMDNDFRTWRAFQNRYWPAKYLIGPTNNSAMGVRYFHFGEGHYEETELEIRAALAAVGKDISDVPFGVEVSVPTRGNTARGRQTRELYAGWRRNNGSGGPYAGQDTYFLTGPGVPTFYTDIPRSQRQHNLWYLQGQWLTEREYIVHARETKELQDYIALIVRGRTANVVLTVADDGSPYDVFVELDGRWLAPNEAGEHVRWDDQGRSYIRVNENDLYRLLFLPEWSEHELTLRSDSDQFRIFAFTFGSYVGGE